MNNLPGDPTISPGVTQSDLEERNREPERVRCAYCWRVFFPDELEDGLCAVCLGEE